MCSITHQHLLQEDSRCARCLQSPHHDDCDVAEYRICDSSVYRLFAGNTHITKRQAQSLGCVHSWENLYIPHPRKGIPVHHWIFRDVRISFWFLPSPKCEIDPTRKTVAHLKKLDAGSLLAEALSAVCPWLAKYKWVNVWNCLFNFHLYDERY